MDLSFSPSQQLLQQSARAFLQPRCPPERSVFGPAPPGPPAVIVPGPAAAGPTALLLPMARAGITARPLASMTGDKLFELGLAGVETGPDDLLGAPGGGWAMLGPACRL